MKTVLLLATALLSASSGLAQKKEFDYKFYGQVRTDLFYNSRANEETVDGLFYMYPKNKALDPDGEDLNATPSSNFYTLYTRLGLNVQGPRLGSAKSSANVEVDFRGSATSYSLFRIRHAYFNLDWGKSALLAGQYWHPLYGDVAPQILNLSVGAPFQPFSRAPQIRYRFTTPRWTVTGAAVWQSQYTSQGPEGKSHTYLKNSCIPELYAGVDYKKNGFMAGFGLEMLSIKPRTQAVVSSKTYKVNERITTLSCEAHAKYSDRNWFVGAKTVLGSNLTQASGLGGYGIKSYDSHTGEQEYAPIRFSSSWINVVYGRKWKPGLFLGLAKNLGTKSATLVSDKTYGTGTDLDQLVSLGAELTYQIKSWKFGMEYMYASAKYGTLDRTDGRVTDAEAVGNHRVVGVAMFAF